MPKRSDDGLAGLLDAVEAAPPVAAVDVFERRLGEQVGAERVSFFLTDFAGQALVRLTHPGAGGPGTERAEQVSLDDETLPYGRAVIEQRLRVLPAPGDGRPAGAVRVLAPVTARGDAIGLLELLLPQHPGEDALALVAAAAHALAYVVTTERRHTDLYEWSRRGDPVSLAGEIQRQLLPNAFTCEAGQFTLAAWLEPASTVGGDTFDYALDADRLYVSMTDAMGHDTAAALLATLAVGSLRNGRRAGHDLGRMAGAANRALVEHHDGLGFVTGLLLSVDLVTGGVDAVDAGHPPPLLVRDGEVRAVPLEPDLPMGVLAGTGYRVQRFRLRPGDRLVLLTDGMVERSARRVDLPGLLVRHRDTHPRQLMRVLTAAVQEAAGGEPLADDATALCLDWAGPGDDRRAEAGASVTGGP
ncbi:serine phosphatase RsbU (regulator of sigma subunit) [Kineococcus radiotolerans]|uniref:Serine phosphatase RsbU (Regulator of sigma subunit) n=1 Tax=Kineococcus radiotolerans TaxID=131568 RepID=A0A7W4XX90_KINRA|nr:PP2C family protein-serine/threonine phosphatase [Kineococcus radiotolerans]MBB2900930.1 serine phosphatase RsbU (regulator of sigma subunit) [Kineococcus radiotolerans]